MGVQMALESKKTSGDAEREEKTEKNKTWLTNEETE